jgi:hypothetical protein
MSERRLRDVSLPPPEHDPDEVRAFLRVVRQALLMIVRYVERRYSL